jgi:hypothetical protein
MNECQESFDTARSPASCGPSPVQVVLIGDWRLLDAWSFGRGALALPKWGGLPRVCPAGRIATMTLWRIYQEIINASIISRILLLLLLLLFLLLFLSFYLLKFELGGILWAW